MSRNCVIFSGDQLIASTRTLGAILGRFQEESFIPGHRSAPTNRSRSTEEQALLRQENTAALVNTAIHALFVSMRSWPLKSFVLTNFGLLCRLPAQWLQTKAAKDSSQNTCLLPHHSEVIDVSFLHFWVLYDFANFNSNRSFDVILSRFHALI